MFVRCNTRKPTDIVFVRQDAKKGPRSTMVLDRWWLFQVTAELQRMPSDKSASVGIRRLCVFGLFNTVVFSFFFFLHFGRMPLPFVCEKCGRVGNGMRREGKMWSRKRWVQMDKKRWGRPSLPHRCGCPGGIPGEWTDVCVVGRTESFFSFFFMYIASVVVWLALWF